MRVKVLGSAAGGGFPQWNCGCSNCRRFRSGTLRGRARSQAQLAVTADDRHWFLLGASPDLRYQIETYPELHPRGPGRNSPISGVALTCADLDHVLGLLHLREWQRLNFYSTKTVRRVLLDGNTIFRMLDRAPGQTNWTEASVAASFNLTTPEGAPSGISARLFGLSDSLPAYAVSGSGSAQESVTALFLESPDGKRLAYVPGLPSISAGLISELKQCQLILIDGTFWTDDELIRIESFGRRARDIGHIAVSGPDGSMAMLSGITTARRIYTHINNTNPMLDEAADEHRMALDNGWEIAFDGMDLTL